MQRGLKIAAIVCVFLLTVSIFQTAPARGVADSDGDGLHDSFETSTFYHQTAVGDGLPKAVPDHGAENAVATLLPWSGIVEGAFANFSVDHPAKEELTVQVGYWNGSAWKDRYVWDPGARLLGVTLTSPAANTFLQGVVTVSASVQEDEILDRVEFYLDTDRFRTLAQPSSPETYSFAWDTRLHGGGSYTLTAVAVDKVGGQSSYGIPVKIDNAKPSVSVTSPSNGGVVGGSVAIAAAASDDYGVQKVEFYVDGGWLATDTSAPYTATWDASSTSGAHTIKAVAYDFTGKTASHQIGVTVDNSAPSVSFGAPPSGAYLRGTYRVKVAASDDNGIAKVELKVDGGAYFAITGNFDGTYYWYDWNTGSVADGGHTLTARATDTVGKANTASVSVTVDNTRPSVAITSPSGGSTVKNTVKIVASASDNIALWGVKFYVDGSYKASDTSSPYVYYWDTTGYANGWHTVKAVARDRAGNTATHQISLYVLNSGDSCTGSICIISRGPGPSKTSPGKGGSVTLATTTTETTSGFSASGSTYTVVADLLKDRGDVTQEERDNRILPAEFDPALFHAYTTWRVVVRDWVVSASTGGGGGGDCATCPEPTGDALLPGASITSTTDPVADTTTTQGTLQAFSLVLEETSDPNAWDTDGDGLGDGDEVNTYGTYPVTGDTDGDGATDDFEVVSQTVALTVDGVSRTETVKTDPLNPDTDGDGLPDGEEYDDGMDGTVTHPTDADTDGDTLSDGDEVLVYYSNATLTDTDGDGFSDSVEVNPRSLTLAVNGASETRTVTTLPYAEDSDGDGLRDDEEWYGTSVYGVTTDPSDPDTDGDGLPDGQERYVKVFRTSKREPIPDLGTGYTERLAVALSVNAARIEDARVMTGIFHTYMGDLVVDLFRADGSSTIGKNLRNRVGGSETNNFTSFDLMEDLGFTASDLANAADWWLRVQDKATYEVGQIEYLEIQVTIRLDPLKADTDGDGLNDTEETTMGLDGFLTDPWRVDTDGDGWGDDEYFAHGTDPTNRDTDFDGFDDPVDRLPLGDAFLRITVDSINVLGDDNAKPFVGVNVLGDETWTRYLSSPSGSYYHDFSINVDDDASSVTFRVEAWSYDSGDNHGEVYIAAEYWVDGGGQIWEIPVNYDDLTIPVNPGESQTWNLRCPDTVCTSSTRRADPLTITASVVVPQRALTRLVVPLDYATVYNLTDADGNVVERRYLGEDRFVVLVGRVYYGTGFGVEANEARLIPRSLFFQSELYHRLNQTNGLTAGPVLDNAKVVWRDIGQANEDALHAVINVGGVLDETWAALAAMALRDADGNVIATSVAVTSYLPLLGVPRAALAVLPYEPLPHSPSAAYTWSSGSMTAVSLWEALWTGATEILAVTLQYVQSALAFYVDFFEVVVESLVQFGLWVWKVVSEAAAVVQAMVGAAQEAFGQVVDWILSFAAQVAHAILDPLLGPLQQLIAQWVANVVESAQFGVREYEQYGYLTGEAFHKLDEAFTGSLYWSLIGLTVAVSVVMILVYPYMTVASFVLGAVVGIIATVVVDSLLGSFTSADDPAPSYSPPASMEEPVQLAKEYDQQRRTQTQFQQYLWTVFAALMAGNAAKWSAIALYAAADPTGRISGIVGIVAGVIGGILGVVAAQANDPQERNVLGISALVFSFASLLFSGLSAIKAFLPDVRILALVGFMLGTVAFGVSVYALYYIG